ncbi:hypothetical protein P7C71_g5717, partial [Lecanoromycetidae sp. Uapishka_2]
MRSATDVGPNSSAEKFSPIIEEGPDSSEKILSDNKISKRAVSSSNWIADDFPVRLAKLEEAYAHQVLYIIGKEQMKLKAETNFTRRVLLGVFLWIRDNTQTKITNLRVPMDRVFEVGFVKDI